MLNETRPTALPGYTDPAIKNRLLEAGASGTIYALVMPESEQGIQEVVDGGPSRTLTAVGPDSTARDEGWLSRFREPWTQKQDSMHEEYFREWISWSMPAVDFEPSDYPFRYPTAGASEGIFKIMSEYAAQMRSKGREPTIHVFAGEYEGFASFAESLEIRVVRHSRDDWRNVRTAVHEEGQFWISQPSSIDGGVWAPFNEFMDTMAKARPDVQIIPDLSYVGAVARSYVISLGHANIPAFVISQSKPFGGYYHRCGGVFARWERPSLLANKWFKNLTSLAWGTRMMRMHQVMDLPQRYRQIQIDAAEAVGRRLGIEGLEASDISMLATAPVPRDPSPLIESLIRGKGSDRCLRVCLTPTMTVMIDPHLAPGMTETLKGEAE